MCFFAAAPAFAAMSTAGKVATVASALSTAVSTYGASQQAQGERRMHRYQAAVASNNAQVADWHAQDAVRRGHQEAHAARRRGEALRGTQRATMAARGLDLSQGTPAALLSETDYFTSYDQAVARHNAAKEAWASQVQGANLQGEARMHRGAARNISPGLTAGMTLLGGASQVADRWFTYTR